MWFFFKLSIGATDTAAVDRYRDACPRWTLRLIRYAQCPHSLLFFNLTSDRIYAVREEQQYKPMKKMTVDETPNDIQTQNKDAEKIDDPRLLRIGRKDTQKDDQ
jgi:hypothetical protein